MAKNDQFAQANVNRHWGNQLAKHGQVAIVFGIIPFNFTSVRVFRTNWNVQYSKINGFITRGKKYVLLVGSNAPMSLRWRIVLKKERKTTLKPIMMEKGKWRYFLIFLRSGGSNANANSSFGGPKSKILVSKMILSKGARCISTRSKRKSKVNLNVYRPKIMHLLSSSSKTRL